MREIGPALRAGYVAALSDIEHEGLPVTGYDELAPPDAGPYYYQITGVTETDASSKDVYASDVHITIDIVTRVSIESTDGTHRDAIADQILQRIVRRNQHVNIGPDFKIITTKKTLAKNLTTQTNNVRLFRKIITFKHLIQEL